MTQADQSIRHAWLELTNTCNLECLHCYSMSGPRVKDQRPHTAKFIADQFEELYEVGCRSIQFIGGEPLASKLFANAANSARNIGFESISVYSNLVALSIKNFDAIKKNGINVYTSFYSHDPSVHDQIVNGKGAFIRTSKNIKMLIDNNVYVGVGIIHIPNLNDDLEQTKKYLVSLGATDISVDMARSFGRFEDVSEDPSKPGVGNSGRCADGTVCISSEGKVFPCIMTRSIEIADLYETSLNSARFSERLGEARKELIKAWNSDQSSQRDKGSTAACRPSDNCAPGACGPQVDGPGGCFPKTKCAPDIFGDCQPKKRLDLNNA